MSLIDDFFLNEDRLRKVLSGKLEGELQVDSAARQALEKPTQQSVAEAAIKAWMSRYSVMPRAKNVTKIITDSLVRAIIDFAPRITTSLSATSILTRHAAICTHCNTVEGIKVKDKNTGIERDRDFTSLASKLLWLMHPDVVPIFDSQAWCAIKVIARISGKIETPGLLVERDSVLERYCAFLNLHALCFSHLYGPIDTFAAKEFSAIFGSTTQKTSAVTEADAKRQYANHMTLIDQLLWHLGGDVAVAGCLTKRIRKNAGAL